MGESLIKLHQFLLLLPPSTLGPACAAALLHTCVARATELKEADPKERNAHAKTESGCWLGILLFSGGGTGQRVHYTHDMGWPKGGGEGAKVVVGDKTADSGRYFVRSPQVLLSFQVLEIIF